MATERQLEANRRNSQKSTGPRTPEGKAVSRFNALQTGIHAASLVIPGEDPAALEALAADYHRQFQPATPLECFLVDTIVHADWQLRRLRRVEAQLWEKEMTAQEKPSLAEAYAGAGEVFTRLQRRIDATERSYFRALRELQRAQAAQPEPVDEPAPGPELASFRTNSLELTLDIDPRGGVHAVPGPVLRDQPVLGPPPR